jgi:hypothetical protein
MDFFGITNIWQKSFGSQILFLEILKFHRLVWIVSVSSMFYFICSNIHFIKCCFIKEIIWKHICGKMYHVIERTPTPSTDGKKSIGLTL